MKLFCLLPLAGALVLAAPASRAATRFCDAFKSKTDPAWGDQSGAWTIAKKRYYATQPSNAPLSYTDLVADQNFRTETVSVTVHNVYDGGVWLRSHWNGAANGILLVVGGAYSNYTGLYWHVVTNGVVGPAQNEVDVPGLQGSTVKLKIVAKGTTYSVFVNGATTATTALTDTTYSSGSVGLYDNSASPQESFGPFCVSGK